VLGVDWQGVLAHGSQGTASPVGAGPGSVGAFRRWRQGSRGLARYRVVGKSGYGNAVWDRMAWTGGARLGEAVKSRPVEARRGEGGLARQSGIVGARLGGLGV
jgi:hypothetical protein